MPRYRTQFFGPPHADTVGTLRPLIEGLFELATAVATAIKVPPETLKDDLAKFFKAYFIKLAQDASVTDRALVPYRDLLEPDSTLLVAQSHLETRDHAIDEDATRPPTLILTLLEYERAEMADKICKPAYARELSRSDPSEREPIWEPRKSCGKTEEPRRVHLRELIFGSHPNGERQERT